VDRDSSSGSKSATRGELAAEQDSGLLPVGVAPVSSVLDTGVMTSGALEKA
jgi:hypothetical protein